MRFENSIRNSFYGMLLQIFVIVIGFINRSFFIKYLGYEYLGYNGLFTNIISILSVAELGIGTAVSISLYVPLKLNDIKKINSIMQLLKKMYQLIGSFILVFGIIITFFIRFFVKEEISNITYIRIIFMLYVVNSILSYFIAYKRTLLIADQKNYIISKIDLITKFVVAVLQIVSLALFQNYIIYMIITIVFTVLENIYISKRVDKEYIYLNSTECIDRELKRKVIGFIQYMGIYKILDIGIFSTDNLIISTILGLRTIGLYSNYSLIITSVQGIFKQVFNAIIPSIGDLIAEKNATRIDEIFRIYNFICFIVAAFSSISLGIMLQPFVKVWLGDSALISIVIVILLAINVYINFTITPLGNFIQASGLIREILPVVFVEFIVNILLSVLLAHKIGLIGVFIGTTSAYIIAFIGQAIILHKHLIKSRIYGYFIYQLKYMGLYIFEFAVCYKITNLLSGTSLLYNLTISTIICIFIPNIINLRIYWNTPECKYIVDKFIKTNTGKL